MIHKLRLRTTITTRDAMGNIKQIKKLENNKITEDTFDIVVKDKKGQTIKEINEIPVKSYIHNLMPILYYFYLNGTAPTSPVDLRIRNVANGIGSNQHFTNQANANGFGGIRVGTGSTAVGIADYTLPSLVVPGTASGQLSHSSHSNLLPVKVGTSTYKISQYRTFTNNSGAPITILSCGLFTGYTTTTATDINLYLSDRFDFNGVPINITLNDGQAMTITYNQYFDLSEGFVFGFCAQWYNGFMVNVTTGLNALEWGGTSIFAGALNNNIPNSTRIVCAAGNNWGIRVGEGQTPITIDDYNLDTMIGIGTGVGELTHNVCEIGDIFNRVGSTESFSLSRSFLNSSGAEIIYRSFGIFARRYQAAYIPDDTKRLLLIKKLTGNIIVPDAGSSTITQDFEITV